MLCLQCGVAQRLPWLVPEVGESLPRLDFREVLFLESKKSNLVVAEDLCIPEQRATCREPGGSVRFCWHGYGSSAATRLKDSQLVKLSKTVSHPTTS